MSSNHGSLKAVMFALIGNAIIAVIKFIVAFVTHSSAMMAEAIHSVADCTNQIFLLIGSKRSAKGPTEQHPFGYGKEEFFWGFMVAVLLFFVGAIFSVYEGIHKLSAPAQLHDVYWSFAVLILSIIIEGKSFHVAYKQFRENTKGISFYKAIKGSADTNLIVILMEDLAALMGLVLVLISTALAWLVHPIFDAIGSIMVGLLLASVSVFLTNELRKLIIGESISRSERHEIKKIVSLNPVVKHVNRIDTMIMGRNKFLLVVSVDIHEESVGHNIEDQLDEIRKDLYKKNKGILTVYIDVKDHERSSYA